MRRAILGDAHVDRSLGAASDFARPLQELITEYAWGAVWTRPELDPRTRSLITIGMLAALGRLPELELHVRAARNTGCRAEEIREVLLQSAIYCGVPAALEAFRVAEAALGDHD